MYYDRRGVARATEEYGEVDEEQKSLVCTLFGK
jgi:hypothetical protein